MHFYMLFIFARVLASQSLQEESNAPSIRKQIVDNDRMRPGHWLVLCVPYVTHLFALYNICIIQ